MMRTQLGGFAAGVAVGAVVTAIALSDVSGSRTMEASQEAGATSKVVLENARVRVRDVTFPTGKSAGMHTHDLPHVGVVIEGGTLVFKYPDGKSETAKLEAGGVGFRDANVTHEPTNPGTTAVRVIEVELK